MNIPHYFKKSFRLLLVLILLQANLQAQQIKYTIARSKWNPDSLGNQRALVYFNGRGKVARVTIPWRRNDPDPQHKRIIVQDSLTGKKINNLLVEKIQRVSGTLCFEPVSGKGNYYVYFMPYKNEGRSNYPRGVYLKPDSTADAAWVQHIYPLPAHFNTFCKEIQSIDAFNSVYPMEVIASTEETNNIIKAHAREPYLVFPEDRNYPIRLLHDLPQRWIAKGPVAAFSGNADKGEAYTFQLGIFALQDLEQLSILFGDLRDAAGHSIAGSTLYCLQTEGVDYEGKPFTKRLQVDKRKIQALWCGLPIPDLLPAGNYKGWATLSARGCPDKKISISINVSNKLAIRQGLDEPWKMTRLHWLNSTLAQENTVIAPYTALVRQRNEISLLGRKLQINEFGLPQQVQTFFTEEMTGFSDTPNNLLGEPIHFHFRKQEDGKDLQWQHHHLQYTKTTPGTVQWTVLNSNDSLQMQVTGSLEFDGFLSYQVRLTALQDLDLRDIAMHIALKPTAAKYMMGLGEKGGLRPDSLHWVWDTAHKNQDGAWLGNVNQGLQFSLRDENYSRPLNTNFYLQKPLVLPTSWGNGSKGGIIISPRGENIVVNNFSGSRSMKKGMVLYYNFNLLITPFHPINTNFQWENRFFHQYNQLDTIKATGATVINIHHATPINPWINYPFIEWNKLKEYIDGAHRIGLKVKIYNTIRELSNHAYETFALRSLGHEVYSSGKGGGFSWLQEHITEDYIAAWFVPEIKDAAIVNSGMNRWHNYYVEGMNWLVKNTGIDGIYLDDVAFDRVTMKRIKRVLTDQNHPGIIDLHSANQYNKNDGFNNSAMLYMEHFPYLNRLWFGEYFDYENNKPDFFLTEVSGIPFGLMGEMLQDGGNAWRGMIYGMTNRMPWSDAADPRPIWKVWDAFGIKGSEMLGYWSSRCPVKTDNDRVLATVYKKPGSSLVAIASWADTSTQIQLQIDWKQLGLDPAKITIEALAITNFQPARIFKPGEPIPVEKSRGWLLIIKDKN